MGDDESLKDGENNPSSAEQDATLVDDSDWPVDDPSVSDEADVLRRLTEPGQVVYDDVSQRPVIGVAAYQYRDDGMSVYVSSAMDAQGLTDDELMAYCDYGVARVSVTTIRREAEGSSYRRGDLTTTVAVGEARETPGGVIMSLATTGPEDPRVRESHALVRIRERPVARALWNAFRHKLIQGSYYRSPDSSDWISADGAA